MKRKRYVVAIYEMDCCYGGPEEGGWWYDTGELERILCIVKDEDRAFVLAQRANRLLHYLRGRNPSTHSISSVLYNGGHYTALVFDDTAPPFFPVSIPRYE